MRAQGVYDWPGVRILEGRWQDFFLDPEKIGDVIGGTPDSSGFTAVFMDTFAEGYEGGRFSMCVELTDRSQILLRVVAGYPACRGRDLLLLERPGSNE